MSDRQRLLMSHRTHLQPDDEEDGGLVILDQQSADPSKHKKSRKESTTVSEEESENELDIEIYDTDEEQDDEQNEQMQHLNCHARDTVLENHVTPITDVTNTTSSGGNSGGSSGGTNKENQMHQNNQTNYGANNGSNNGTQHGANNAPPNSTNDKPREKKNDKKDSGSRTMEQWLKSDNLTVFPVWIGNLPKGTTVSQLRQFVEGVVGRVLVSIHISTKQTSNDRTYAFLNLPTAEPFKQFRDSVVPSILANPTTNLNVTSVRKILEQHHIPIEQLPNRVWCVQCTLVPQCHRTYCSFYHCSQEKELGRIISILAAQRIPPDSSSLAEGGTITDKAHHDNLIAANNPNTLRSKHTLLIQGLPRSVSNQKIEETFTVYGRIDNVIVNPDHTCYVRMKRSQDARKIVHLFRLNQAGIRVDFSPYGAGYAKIMGNGMTNDGASGGDHSNSDDEGTGNVTGNNGYDNGRDGYNTKGNHNGNHNRNLNGNYNQNPNQNSHQNGPPNGHSNDMANCVDHNNRKPQMQQTASAHWHPLRSGVEPPPVNAMPHGDRLNGVRVRPKLRETESEHLPRFGVDNGGGEMVRPKLDRNAVTMDTHLYNTMDQNNNRWTERSGQWNGYNNQERMNSQHSGYNPQSGGHNQMMNNQERINNQHGNQHGQHPLPPRGTAKQQLRFSRTQSEPIRNQQNNQYPGYRQQQYPSVRIFDGGYPSQQHPNGPPNRHPNGPHNGPPNGHHNGPNGHPNGHPNGPPPPQQQQSHSNDWNRNNMRSQHQGHQSQGFQPHQAPMQQQNSYPNRPPQGRQMQNQNHNQMNQMQNGHPHRPPHHSQHRPQQNMMQNGHPQQRQAQYGQNQMRQQQNGYYTPNPMSHTGIPRNPVPMQQQHSYPRATPGQYTNNIAFTNPYSNNSISGAFSHGMNHPLSPVAQTPTMATNALPTNFMSSPTALPHGMNHLTHSTSAGSGNGLNNRLIPNGVNGTINGTINGLPPSNPMMMTTTSDIRYRQSNNLMTANVNTVQRKALDDMLSPRTQNGFNSSVNFMTDALASLNMTRPTGLSLSGGNPPQLLQQPLSVNNLSVNNPTQTLSNSIPLVVPPTQFSFPLVTPNSISNLVALTSPRADGSIAGAPTIAGNFAPPPLHFQLSADVMSPTSALKQK